MALKATVLEEGKAAGDACEVLAVDAARVAAVRARMRPEATFHALAETFRALADPTRSQILYALSHEELCVCDLSTLLGLSQSATSHQLRILRNMRLVKYRKEGRMVYYALDDQHIRTLIDVTLEHVEE